MTKSQLISLIQQLPSVVTVEPIHISPEETDELLCLITFLPVEIPEQLTIQEISELKNGDHFWANVKEEESDGNNLAALIKSEDNFYVCGAWECSVPESEIEFIEMINLPKGYSVNQLYY